MDIDVVIEMLRNNRALWVSATVTGGFAVLVSIANIVMWFFQQRRQHKNALDLQNHKHEYDRKLEDCKKDFNKEMEIHKSVLASKNHVSRARFDTEFQIYKELSKDFWLMVFAVIQLYPQGLVQIPVDKEKEKELYFEQYKEAQEHLNAVAETLSANAAFINKSICEKFEALWKKSRNHAARFKWWELEKYTMSEHRYQQLLVDYMKLEDYQKRYDVSGEIYKEMQEITEMIREHLVSLESYN